MLEKLIQDVEKFWNSSPLFIEKSDFETGTHKYLPNTLWLMLITALHVNYILPLFLQI